MLNILNEKAPIVKKKTLKVTCPYKKDIEKSNLRKSVTSPIRLFYKDLGAFGTNIEESFVKDFD